LINEIKRLWELNCSFPIDGHSGSDHIWFMSEQVAHLNRNREGSMNIVRSLRLTASFALLGAVITGVLLGWHDLSFDPRLIGAAVGAAASVVAQVVHAV
jgi:hypothetical protein